MFLTFLFVFSKIVYKIFLVEKEGHYKNMTRTEGHSTNLLYNLF